MILLKTKLYEHQIRALQFHLSKNRSGDWSEMGVGKSLIALAKAVILYNRGIVKRILVIAPKSVIPTWIDEIKKHTTFTYVELDGSIERKLSLLKKDANIFVVSYDSIPGRKRTSNILYEAVLKRGFHLIICDEVTYLKSASAIRTKVITKLCNIIGRNIFLSGSPITNDPESVLTIYNALDGGQTFGKNFFAARAHFFENRGYAYPDWHIRPDKIEEFHKRLYYNCTRVLKSECLDLPDKVFVERYTNLSPRQQQLYTKVANNLLKELTFSSGKVSIQNSLVKIAKLSQIANGFVYTDDATQVFQENPKLDLLLEVINEIGRDKKIIIYAKWLQDIKNIEKLLSDENIPYVLFDGSTSERDMIKNQFINDPNVSIFLSQITKGAYGLTLHTANYMIYYSIGFSLIDFIQSQDRIHRIGQRSPCTYITLIVNGTIDKYIYDTLRMGIDIRKSILDIKSFNRLKQNLELFGN